MPVAYVKQAGRRVKVPLPIERRGRRYHFPGAHYVLKDDLKALKGSKWDGRAWSAAVCPRNDFQLARLQGEKVYEWFDRPLEEHTTDCRHPLKPHQCDLVNAALTYKWQIWAAEMRTGKTLAALATIELSGAPHWVWVGPKPTLSTIRREFDKWGFNWDAHRVDFVTFDGLKKLETVPDGLIIDEASRLKNANSQRTQAAQRLADAVRPGYVLLLTGTPSPKSPVDWWALAEVCFPGYLKEGSPQALERRLAHFKKLHLPHGIVHQRVAWDEDEVAHLERRLRGLVVVKRRKDCLSLPPKTYHVVRCQPSAPMLRVADAIKETAPSAIQALTQLRELSDGFQYTERIEGTMRCPACDDGTATEWYDPDDADRVFVSVDFFDDDFVARLSTRSIACPTCDGTRECPRAVRDVRQVVCPKDDALREILDKHDDDRAVIFAGFTGSVDRCVELVQAAGWATIRCDGRGMVGPTRDPLEAWDTYEGRLAFVAHPESGGMGLNLSRSRFAVFYSNTFKAEYRTQAEDRIIGLGMPDDGGQIYDLIHLPSDERVLDVVRENRRLELLTMGEI